MASESVQTVATGRVPEADGLVVRSAGEHVGRDDLDGVYVAFVTAERAQTWAVVVPMPQADGAIFGSACQ